MRDLVNSIIVQNELQIIPVESDPEINIDFAYYELKDDFFIFFYCDYEYLITSNGGDITNLEYYLNALIIDLKNNEAIKVFKERNLEYNLSFILVIEINEENKNSIYDLNKIQENNKNAKKYILPYNKNELNTLKEKISRHCPINEELNRISIENSNCLGKKEQRWYELLMSLFIKIPFMNYLSVKENNKLGNISEAINDRLSKDQKSILSIIEKGDFNDSNIEKFLFDNKLISN